MLGFQDETWWTRLAQSDPFAWPRADPLRLGANARDPNGGGPEPVACYGVLRAEYHKLIDSGVLGEDDRVELPHGYLMNKLSQNPPHGGSVKALNRLLSRLVPGG